MKKEYEKMPLLELIEAYRKQGVETRQVMCDVLKARITALEEKAAKYDILT